MTNLEVIKLMAEKRLDLLAQFINDIYCTGWNESQRNVDEFFDPEEWLNKEYDKDYFREEEVVK